MSKQNAHLSVELIAPLMGEMLAAGKEVLFLPEGESMRPLLPPGRCRVVLTRIETPPKKHDVLFYRRANGACVLHRVVAVREDGLVMCGDNQYGLETGLKRENLIGRMKGFYDPAGRYHGLDSAGYRLYCNTLGLHRGLLRLRAGAARRLRRLLGRG